MIWLLVVETEYGKVEGMNLAIPNDPQKRVAKVFLGIPFAKPPIGKLRFEVRICFHLLFKLHNPISETSTT